MKNWQRVFLFTFFAVALGLGGLWFHDRQSTPPAQAATSLPVMLGVYTGHDLQSSIDEIVAMTNWLQRNNANGITFAGDFISLTFHPDWNVPHELEAISSHGFVPFVNIGPSAEWEGDQYDPNCATLTAIAAGQCDATLQAWAGYFKNWVEEDPDTHRAFLAPYPEANGDWTSYSSDGPTFISAYRRLVQIFADVGVPRANVRWVFAPNGWSDPSTPARAFENYYPGDDVVDVLAFSAYNFGGCPEESPWRTWDTYENAIKPYLDRMRALSYAKPIFLAQTGTVGVPDDPSDPNQNKSQWVRDTFAKLAAYPGFRGLIYFNTVKAESSLVNCPEGADYRLYYPDTDSGEPGLIDAMQDDRYGVWTPQDPNWANIAFTDVTPIFADMPPVHPFNGSPPPYYYDDVLSLYQSGITQGCALDPLRYCPDQAVTRAEMAVFLERGIHYPEAYEPPDVTTVFPDAQGHWAERWIEALRQDGITTGYPDGTYHPDEAVSRAAMAVFLLRALKGADYSPPTPDQITFQDVPADYWAAPWIEALYQEGITSGCSADPPLYCPETAVTRGQMAVFLVRTFQLPPADSP